MRRKWAALICAIGTILAGCTPERAAEGPSLHRQPLGTMVAGRVQIGIATVDLPPGDWMLVAADHVRRAATDGSQ